MIVIQFHEHMHI